MIADKYETDMPLFEKKSWNKSKNENTVSAAVNVQSATGVNVKPQGVNVKSPVCFKCKSSAHYVRNCPQWLVNKQSTTYDSLKTAYKPLVTTRVPSNRYTHGSNSMHDIRALNACCARLSHNTCKTGPLRVCFTGQ